jgi:hypothetical protein
VGTRKPVFVRAVTGAKKKSNPITQGAKPANIVDVLAGAVWGQPFEESAPILSRALGSRGALRCGGGEDLDFPKKKACNNSYTGV